MVSPTFFSLSLNMAIRSSWSKPQSAPGLVFAECIELLHLWLQRSNQSDFGVDHLMMSMCRVFSYVVARGCLLWPVHSLGKILLAFALLHSVFQGQIYLLPYHLLPSLKRFPWIALRMYCPKANTINSWSVFPQILFFFFFKK